MPLKEENFPRSKPSKHPTSIVPAYQPSIAEDEQLFKSRKRKTESKPVQPKKRSKKTVKRHETNEQNQENLKKTVIENLTLSRLIENTVILGCIQEITDFELKFSITGGIDVTVPITNISTSYSQLIESFANNENEDSVEIAKLASLFNLGQYFPIRILSKRICDKFGHAEVIGSINPKDVYHNFTSRTFQKLPSGYNLIAAVLSKEDHGYLMDIGIEDLKAFLPNEDLEQNNFTTLNIGQVIHCSVSTVNERSLTLTTDQTKGKKFCIEDDHQPGILFYSPGINTNAIITETFNHGIELGLPGGYKGFVPRFHVSDDLSVMPKQLKIGDTVQGHVMYVHPHTKQVCVSLKSKMKMKKIKNLIDSIRIGSIIDNAIVCSRSQNGGVIFRLPGNNYSIALKKNLFEPNEFDENNYDRLYRSGSSHRVRVKKFHLIDNLIEISLRKSFIDRKDLTIDDIDIGTIVEGVVKKYRPDGVYVKLGFGINGFIPNIHLTDTPTLNWEKIRTQFFPLKKQVQCRVLKLDQTTRIPKIALTAKKTLIKMNDEEMFKDFDKITARMSSTGVVCLITDKGILLEFFNRVRGFIPTKFLATYKIEYPDKVFRLGQLIKCTVISVNPTDQHMVCSLIDIDETKKLKMNLQIKTKNDTYNSKLKVGQILKRMRIISKTPMKGFDLTDVQEKIQVFLPMAHLSDDTYISRILFGTYKIGDIIDELMVFSKDSANVVCVTMKPIFLNQNYPLIMNEQDVQLKSPFPAIVRNVTPTGVFFETTNAQYGVVRKKFLQDGFIEEPKKLDLCRGQTIFVNAIDVSSYELTESNDNYLKRFKFSMRLSDVWNKDSNESIEIFKSYLKQMECIRTSMKNMAENESIRLLSSYSIGEIITFIITEINDDHIKMDCSRTGNKHEPTVAGIAMKHESFADLTISQMGMAIVCDIDFDRKNLILFIQSSPGKLIRQVKNFQRSNLAKIKPNQTIKGTVIHVNPKYILTILGGHLPGLIAYVPARKHYNDLRHVEKLFTINYSYQFMIKHFDYNDNHIEILVSLHDQTKKPNEVHKESLKKSITQSINKSDEINENTEAVKNKSKNPEKHIENSTTTIDRFDWNVLDLSKLTNKRKFEELQTKSVDDFDFDIENDSDDESNNELNSKKHRNRDERNEEARKREIMLREKEQQLTDLDRKPKDEQDFEMAIVAKPNSSYIWIEYMAFMVERKEIEKAKEIGERALKKISFREEKEKLNIWTSLLNLENQYGDERSMQELIEKAVKFNDAKTIYNRVAIIYDESDHKDKAEMIYNFMIKKFYSDISTWISFLLFYMKNNQIEKGRKLFVKALASIEKRQHIDLISKFAQFEFCYGDYENGKTLFEKLLALYWERLDKWSIYIDMLIKYTLKDDDDDDHRNDSIEFIRNIFERLLTFKFSPHKMRFIFKKYYDFEMKYSCNNDDDLLERLKQKAAEYVEHGKIVSN
uniref:rRNA biogenesis protein RRP5 n=1 Tax=Dermatophagoides pteronyssinus TaxID=6956 RepID=A0A6P6YI36_DERPT|nr:protein RRP5 homolog [Dermatophagoides pteronyssinus]